MTRSRNNFTVVLWLACLGLATGNARAAESSVGLTIADFRLSDARGKAVSLADFPAAPAVVIGVWGTECPLARLYAPRMTELARRYQSRGVAFLLIDSNQQDSLADLAAMGRQFALPMPLLKDVGNVVADALGATRTPQVFVLDRERRVRYAGRVDDQFSVGVQRDQPTRHDLREALDDVLAGRSVRVPETTAAGCLIGRVRAPDTSSEVTYAGQIAGLLQRRCVQCHRAGEVAPMPLVSYEEVAGWAEMIREVVQEGRMPPWHADPRHGAFANDPRLSEEEKSLIDRWVAAGAPEGNRAETPPTPTFPVGWQIPRVDQTFPLGRRPFKIPAEGVLSYRYAVIDPGFEEDRWVESLECRPGNPAVVHHILLFVQRKGQIPQGHGGLTGYLGCFVPGGRPQICPPHMARRIPKGARLIAQIHYVTNGMPQEDHSQVGLAYVDPDQIDYEVRTQSAMNALFAIPPHESDFEVPATRGFRRETLLLGMFPHMHLRGKAFRYTLRYPDGHDEILLDVPRYDFNWQHTYVLAEPKVIPPGARLLCRAVFDNSADNPANPDPSQYVTFGDQTFDEMLIGYFDAAILRPGRGPSATLQRDRSETSAAASGGQ